MANIRVDLDYMHEAGYEIKFRSPADCSAITGLVVYYPGASGATTSKVFMLADAHGNNVGDIDHLFTENVVVKVILDVTNSVAFVQNADTNAYLEEQLAGKLPLDGSTPMTGPLKLQGDFARLSGDDGSMALISFTKAGDSSDRRVLMMMNRTQEKNDSFSLVYRTTTNGVNSDYQIFNERNKPKGTYTGNGSAAKREINIGGINNVLKINCVGNSTLVLVSDIGAVVFSTGAKVIGYYTAAEVKYQDGVLTLNTNSPSFNGNGNAYHYEF
jgi:hypothetical protein